jgi:hypothetical protein
MQQKCLRPLPLFGTIRDRLDSGVSRTAYTASTCSSENPWDELSLVINCNFMRAVTENGQCLRLSLSSLRSGATTTTLRHASVAFIKTWGFLLEGCEDFVAVTNVWRNRKGEKSLTLDFGAVGR